METKEKVDIDRIMKAAKKVIEMSLNGDVSFTDSERGLVIAKINYDIYIFFVDWSTEGFPDHEISRKKFEETLGALQEEFFDDDFNNTSILPGHIAFWVYKDRAFVRVTRGVDLS